MVGSDGLEVAHLDGDLGLLAGGDVYPVLGGHLAVAFLDDYIHDERTALQIVDAEGQSASVHVVELEVVVRCVEVRGRIRILSDCGDHGQGEHRQHRDRRDVSCLHSNRLM